MKFGKIGVVSSRESWFVPYAKKLVGTLKDKGFSAKLFFEYREVPRNYDMVLILSYFKVIKHTELSEHKFNFVVHESNLPKGKGWAPLFWQILEGKNKIPITLFEATKQVDSGNVYLKDFVILSGHELHDEIRAIQAEKTIEMCIKLLDNFGTVIPRQQRGKETYYRRRIPQDSKLNIDRTLREQFNLLRIVDNEHYPAFFYYRGRRYIIKVYGDQK